ncbi:SprB repeat-containing protein, partial [Flavobacteriaceae bacterium]|nr:SprB repeat-containing protein [Flavobacteriaceae bacterium]
TDRGGPAKSLNAIAIDIASDINTRNLPVTVTPNFYGNGTIKIEANVAGTNFTDSASTTRIGAGSSITITRGVQQTNKIASYVYRWQKGPTLNTLVDFVDGNDKLRIEDLEPGLYQLSVSINAPGTCTTVMSNTIEIQAAPELKPIVSANCAGEYTVVIDDLSGTGIPSYYTNFTYTVTNQSSQTVFTRSTTATRTTINVLPGAQYVVQVEIETDNGVLGDNCIILSDPFTAWNNLTLIPSRATISNISCFGASDGSITISNTTLFVQGGSGGYDFNWSGPGGFTSTDQSIYSLDPGNYTLEVVDRINASCSSSTSFIITEPTALTANPSSDNTTQLFCAVETSTPGASWGKLEIEVTGGTPPYSYIWKTQPSGVEITDRLAAEANRDEIIRISQPGLYSVEVSDSSSGSSSCTILQTFNVIGNIVPVTAEISINSTASITTAGGLSNGTLTFENNGCNGTEIPVELNFSGGNGGYEYRIISGTSSGSWQQVTSSSGSSTSRLIENLSSGQYSFEIRDIADCNINGTYPKPVVNTNTSSGTITINSINIVDNQADPLVLEKGSTTITEIDCESDIKGSIQVEISGGVKPYRLVWNGPGIDREFELGLNDTTFALNDLESPGNYTVTIKDASDCQSLIQESFTLGDTSAVALGKPQITSTVQSCGSDVLPEASVDIPNSTDIEIYWETLGQITTKNRQINNVFISNPSNGDSFTLTISDIDYVYTATSSDTTNDVLLELANLITTSNVSTSLVTNTNQTQSKLIITGATIGEEIPISVSGVFTSNFASISMTSVKNAIENRQGYVKIPDSDGSRTIYDLLPGYYHAVVNDPASCITYVTDDIYITSGSFEITNTRLDYSVTCGTSTDPVTADYGFTIEGGGNESLQIELNGQNITLAAQLISNGNRYTIRNLAEGEYALKVSSNSVSSPLCPLNTSFLINPASSVSIRELDPNYLLDPIEIPLCDNFYDFTLDETKISGGIPFYDSSGSPYYAYQWIRPDGSRILNRKNFRATPGVYELRLQDSNGCTNDLLDPILIEFIYPYEDLVLSPGLINEDGEEVYSLPVSCGIEANDGRMSVNISGGAPDLEIKWYRLGVNSSNVSSSSEIEIIEWQGQQDVPNVEAGLYKIVISAIQGNSSFCSGKRIGYNFAEKTIRVEDDKSIVIQDGPIVSDELCLGLPGTLIIDVLDSEGSEVEFRYGSIESNESVNSSRIDEDTYEVYIFEPLETAYLFVLNERGCVKITEINLDLGSPAFEYSSVTLEQGGNILANETITFSNESSQPYSRWEWYFGDGTIKKFPIEKDLLDNDGDGFTNYAEDELGFDKNDPSDFPLDSDGDGVPDGLPISDEVVTHEYNISGTYYTTLRIFNSSGCYDDITEPISVGKGYYILKPNVFTPFEDDNLNDEFSLLISGFVSYNFTIYDYKGNLVYHEINQETDPTNPTGLKVFGWDANGGYSTNGSTTIASESHNGSPYYVYVFQGTLLKDWDTDPKTINETGTFILLD